MGVRSTEKQILTRINCEHEMEWIELRKEGKLAVDFIYYIEFL